jgi:uncharacterized protein GlcG (DUF336 family)
MMVRRGLVSAIATLLLVMVTGGPAHADGNCKDLPNDSQLKALLVAAQAGSPASPGDAGGIFHGKKMWGAIVNRDGALCSVAVSTADPTDVWPGSQAIAKHKAYTANAFSVDELALSTARLYTFVQPGHSLFGLNQSNPFDPKFLAPPRESSPGGGRHQIVGGIITFGGGVPLYRAGQIIGGLGVSGDTACADHEIAKKVRDLAVLNPPGGAHVDDISYTAAPSPGTPPQFTHPGCLNTFRDGVALPAVTEPPATGY